MRNYDTIVRRIEALDGDAIDARVGAEVHGLPVFHISVGQAEDRPTVYLCAGTHGDEPGGVEAALAFLEGEVDRWQAAYRFEVLPCLNPFGYIHDVRGNAEGVDLNWAYARTELPEIALVHRIVENRRFELAVDFHEDWESPGYYVYELRRGGPPVGFEIVQSVSEVCPVNVDSTIEGDPAELGVIHPDPDSPKRRERGAGIPIALFKQHTDHLVTSETPTSQPLDVRTRAHLAALNVLLNSHGGANRRRATCAHRR